MQQLSLHRPPLLLLLPRHDGIDKIKHVAATGNEWPHQHYQSQADTENGQASAKGLTLTIWSLPSLQQLDHGLCEAACSVRVCHSRTPAGGLGVQQHPRLTERPKLHGNPAICPSVRAAKRLAAWAEAKAAPFAKTKSRKGDLLGPDIDAHLL